MTGHRYNPHPHRAEHPAPTALQTGKQLWQLTFLAVAALALLIVLTVLAVVTIAAVSTLT